jgi:hypothetical protein
MRDGWGPGAPGGPAKPFSLAAASFILGIPLGAVWGQRPLAWAWICGTAGAAAWLLASCAAGREGELMDFFRKKGGEVKVFA